MQITKKKEGESCKSLWECENYLGCYKERCTLFGSVENGQGVSSEEIPINDSAIRNMFCKHGKTDKKENTCAEIDYANETYDKSVLSQDHFVECKKKNELCYYFDGGIYYNTLKIAHMQYLKEVIIWEIVSLHILW